MCHPLLGYSDHTLPLHITDGTKRGVLPPPDVHEPGRGIRRAKAGQMRHPLLGYSDAVGQSTLGTTRGLPAANQSQSRHTG